MNYALSRQLSEIQIINRKEWWLIKDFRNISFSNAYLEVDEETNEITIIEVSKDNTEENNLTDILKGLVGAENISISIKKSNN